MRGISSILAQDARSVESPPSYRSYPRDGTASLPPFDASSSNSFQEDTPSVAHPDAYESAPSFLRYEAPLPPTPSHSNPKLATTSTYPSVPKSNFVFINCKGKSFLQQFLIDPTLKVPESFLEPGSTDHNINIASDVDVLADVWIVCPASSRDLNVSTKFSSGSRTYVRIHSGEGHDLSIQVDNITLKLAPTASSNNPYDKLVVLHIAPLYRDSQEYRVIVGLPRNFSGMVIAPSISNMSDVVQSRLTQFVDNNGIAKSFLGDLTVFENSDREYCSLTIPVAGSGGKIYKETSISFVDEIEDATKDFKTMTKYIEHSTLNVYFDIAIDGKPAGRIIFKLFDNIVPRTSQNFRELCTKQHGFGYEGSRFHRIWPKSWIHGGDFTHGNGTGGKSIYGDDFADENYELKHNKPYLLSMANPGNRLNRSQFFITTAIASRLDGLQVVFGEVISGFELVKKIGRLGSSSGFPKRTVTIAKSGTC